MSESNQPGPVKARILERRVEAISRALDAHAGGLELSEVTADGAVTVRFTGMCTGCPLRPVSLVGLVRPALMSIDGVTSVSASGGRISAEAESRMVKQMRAFGTSCLIDAISEIDEREVERK